MNSYAVLFLMSVIGGVAATAVGFYKILGCALIVTCVLLLKIPVVLNEVIYKKFAVSIVGFAFGLLGDRVWSQPIHCIEYAFHVVILIGALVFLFPLVVLRIGWQCRREDIQNWKKNKNAWKNRNLFSEREEDLKRLKQYLIDENVNIIGIEGGWGSGKTFLMEGLQEYVSEKRNYEIVIVDVLSVRLDKYPEYLVREMEGLLRKNGIFSQNSQKLRKLLETANLTYLSFLWMGLESQYTKIFDKFRAELLGLNKHIIIIYEDLDRVNDVNGVKDILYLSEKLTAKNDEWYDAGIHVIYQYNPNHMEEIGLTEEYMEKYIPCRMHLSQIDFFQLVRKMQGHVEEENLQHLTDDEIYRLPYYFIGIRGNLLQKERQWMTKHFTERITIRRVKNFLREFSIKIKAYSPLLNQEERNLVISMCFLNFSCRKYIKN